MKVDYSKSDYRDLLSNIKEDSRNQEDMSENSTSDIAQDIEGSVNNDSDDDMEQSVADITIDGQSGENVASENVSSPRLQDTEYSLYEFEEIFSKLPLGLVMSYKKDTKAVVVSGFNTIGSSHGFIIIGDELLYINETKVEGMKSKAFLKVVNAASCPITIKFRRRIPKVKGDEGILRNLDRKDLLDRYRIFSDEESRNYNLIERIRSNGDMISSLLREMQTGLNKTEQTNSSINSIDHDRISEYESKLVRLLERFQRIRVLVKQRADVNEGEKLSE